MPLSGATGRGLPRPDAVPLSACTVLNLPREGQVFGHQVAFDSGEVHNRSPIRHHPLSQSHALLRAPLVDHFSATWCAGSLMFLASGSATVRAPLLPHRLCIRSGDAVRLCDVSRDPVQGSIGLPWLHNFESITSNVRHDCRILLDTLSNPELIFYAPHACLLFGISGSDSFRRET